MDRKRDELIVNVDVDREVTWDDVNRKSRVPKGDASTAAKHESVYMRASIWELLYGSFYMGQQSTQRTQQSTYGSLYMGACIWERLYGSFYMGASIWGNGQHTVNTTVNTRSTHGQHNGQHD